MRPRQALVLAALALCAGVLPPRPVHGTGEEQESGTEEGEEKETKVKTEEVTEEEGVLVLHGVNFARALEENPSLLVEFYAPWCGHCQRFEPVYSEAAAALRGRPSPVRLAKVDAVEEKDLAEEFGVTSFPTLKFFTKGERGNAADFTGKRTVKGVLQWLDRRTGPSAVLLQDRENVEELISAHNLVVVGFFTSLDGDDVKSFYEVALNMEDVVFGISSSAELFTEYQLEKDTVVLFKTFDEKRTDLLIEEKLDIDILISFIQNNSLELVITFSEENADKIFNSKVHKHLLFFLNGTLDSHKALVSHYQAVASEFKGKVMFITIDITGAVSHVLNYFGLSESDAPALRLIDTDSLKKYAAEAGTAITAETTRALCQGVLDGSIKPHLMSQPIPEDWDKTPVKVLVGKNFDAVVFDEARNVLVEFYAPWCGHCQELAPVWEELAEKYKGRDDIIIANMDATANEVESVGVSGYPTIKYFPAGTERKVVDYNGNRDLESFSKFLDNGGVLPEEEMSEDEDDDDDDEEEEKSDDKVLDESGKKSTNTSSKDEL
ncbi:protein disulfide-isomerase A2 [Denticeps clupeoides]|uniref:protein disulfide-isomerase A2 n=1 Tax=Denticeps clupeoides TaxID=299321 RepID=UPI0010A2FD40|nr:protein disulfide-isomerase A2 [Denticeps clupeoides]